jgi:2-oxoacid:acceptor oxidoreductase delta subunit (pyruvate/2-ketoisovalerate family)
MSVSGTKPRRKPPLGIVTRPGSSLRNKTGSWGMLTPVFDCTKCTGCNTCESICPEGCIRHLEKKQYEADLDFCKGCGLCAAACPAGAITMAEQRK